MTLHAGPPRAVRGHARRRRRGRAASASRRSCAPSARSSSARGAYNSPQLLMLSGVGPAEHLATCADRGRSLDQPGVGGEPARTTSLAATIWTTEEPVSLLLALEPDGAGAASRPRASGPAHLQPRRSPAASGAPATGLAAPDLQFHGAPVQIVDEGLADPNAPRDHVTAACLLTPTQPRHACALRLERPDGASRRSATTSTAERRTSSAMLDAPAADRSRSRRAAGAGALLPRAATSSRPPTPTPPFAPT